MKRSLLSLTLLGVVLAAGCGGSGGDPDADPASIVPARAPLYLEATIDPDDETAGEIKALSQKLAGVPDPGAEIIRQLEDASKEGGGDQTWEKDIEPWIGDRVGIFFTSLNPDGEDPDFAVVAPATDADKAQKALEKQLATPGEDEKPPTVTSRTYKDVDYKLDTANGWAGVVVDDMAVLGTDEAVKGAIDGSDGESLAEADTFKRARDQVSDDGPGFAYARLSTLFSGLGPEAAALGPVLDRFGDAVAVALDTEEDAIRLEAAAIGAKGGAGGDPGALVEQMPGDAWFAAGTGELGKSVEESLAQFEQLGAFGGVDLNQALGQLEQQTGIDVRRDVLSWMGDAALFVQGDSLSRIGGALVIASKDPARSEALVGDLTRLARQIPGIRVQPLRQAGVDAGLTVRSSELPLPVHIAAAGERFVIAVTDGALEAALEPPSPTLGESEGYKAAADDLDDEIKPSFFLDVAPVRALLDETGAFDGDPSAEQARKALEKISHVAAGGSRDGDVQRGRIVVGVE